MSFKSKRENWQNKRRRIKSHLTIGRYPRLVVYRSNANIYAQVIDDNQAVTLAAASSVDRDLQAKIGSAKSKIEKSTVVGEAIAQSAKSKDISRVVFDRNGYMYHGRVKALAEAARKAGLEF